MYVCKLVTANKKADNSRCKTAVNRSDPSSGRLEPEFLRATSEHSIPTVEKALKMIKQSNKERGKTLRNRLIDLTAIYTQNMPPGAMEQLEKPKRKKVVTKKNNSPPIDESISSKEKRGYKQRDWTKPLKQCGGWVRVFPFDEITNEQCRGRLGFDVKLIVNRIYCSLKTARQITLDKPGHTDDFYSTALKKLSKLTSEVWLPPV